MKNPRIYTYKITFDEVPFWYWGVHKEKRFNDGYLGSPVTHKWMWSFYTPYLQICELFPYTLSGWKEACELEKRIILPDLNNPLCLNERVGSIASLETCRKGGEKIYKDKKGIHSRTYEQMVNDGKKGNKSPGGLTVKNNKLGIFGRTPDQRTRDRQQAASITNSQRWKSLLDGFESTASGVSAHNKSKGWNPKDKVRIY